MAMDYDALVIGSGFGGSVAARPGLEGLFHAELPAARDRGGRGGFGRGSQPDDHRHGGAGYGIRGRTGRVTQGGRRRRSKPGCIY